MRRWSPTWRPEINDDKIIGPFPQRLSANRKSNSLSSVKIVDKARSTQKYSGQLVNFRTVFLQNRIVNFRARLQERE